ncbi:PilZ domain-containing protein [Hyalangium rubrum]|uniref:PilZ domain-containing protein n=1 Tax=Hyalangium rubrum TaxID=3103134 RepID=A0ABU5HIS0_9BACT|nr:PilZ domain-containing protein [Hyalangium sp. s54d21]MDY7233160.1 PilZ domain-containing protein [Hyalangium sp. s54d21]
MQSDNRMSTREAILGYRMGTELSAIASFGGVNGAECRLVQLSLEHLTLHLTAGAELRPGQRASVVLGPGEWWTTSLQAEVTDVSRVGPEASPELRLRFVAPPLDAGRRIVSALELLRDNGHLLTPEARPVWREVIHRQDRILRICEALVARGTRGVARLADGSRVEVRAAHFDKYEGVLGWRADGPLPAQPFSMEAFGYSSVQYFAVDKAWYEGGMWMMPLPVELTRYRHRWLRRANTATECCLSFEHPLWPQVRVRRQLLDVSYEGLSFLTEPGEDLLYPGMRVPTMEVEMPGRAPVKLFAEVRNISSQSKGRRCGMWLAPLDVREEQGWRELVDEQIHPRTRVAGDWNAGVWELFERSGYFRLSGKEPTKFAAFKAQFEETHEKLQRHPRLGYRVVRPMPGGVEGTASVLRPYEHTLFAHQLARQQPPGPEGRGATAREALRDIYLRTLEPSQLDPGVKWYLAYCEANVRWIRLINFDFASWYEDTGQAAVMPFRFMEGKTDWEWPAIPEHLELEAPTPEELSQLFSHLEKTRPLAYREALDLVPERFDLGTTRARWDTAKLTREREVLVARAGGKALAVAILETAEPGLNLFHVLDGVRIIPLQDEALPEVQEAMLALLSRASRWYQARGRSVFVHYVEARVEDYARRAQLTDLGEGKVWIISRSLLPEFLEHLCEASTPRAE